MAQVTLRKARFIDMVFYGFGGIGANIPFVFIGSYLSFFYTDVFGLAPAIVSGLMLGSKIIDAIIDPFIGTFADHINTKLGRFRPFMIIGAPFMGLGIWLVFTTPSFDPNLKVLYACVTYALYVVASSLVVIPSNSVANLMSADPKQRATVQTFKQGMAAIPQFMSAMALPLVAALGGGEAGWSNYGIVMGIATCLCYWVCAFGARKYDTQELALEENAGQPEQQSFIDIVKSIIDTYRNKQLLLLIGSFSTEMTVFTLSSTMNMYYFTYVLGHQDWVAATSMIAVIAGIVGTLTAPFFVRLWGKKRAFQIFVLISIVPNAAMLVMPNPTLAIVTVFVSVYTCMSKLVGVLNWSMIPDVVDHGEYTKGIRANGLTQASVQLVNQFGQALGGSVSVAIIGALGYVAGQAQTPIVLAAIVFLRWGLPCILHILSFICMHFYELTDERVAEIGLELAKRHEAAKNKEK